MNARDLEAALLARCVLTATASKTAALDKREANIFMLASSVVRSRFPQESKRLRQASEEYFAAAPTDRLSSEEVVRSGWVLNLPRLRAMLEKQLALHEH